MTAQPLIPPGNGLHEHQPRGVDELIAEYTHELLAPGISAERATEIAQQIGRLRIHQEQQQRRKECMPPRCEECHVNYSDPPSRLCPGCEAYREHTR